MDQALLIIGWSGWYGIADLLLQLTDCCRSRNTREDQRPVHARRRRHDLKIKAGGRRRIVTLGGCGIVVRHSSAVFAGFLMNTVMMRVNAVAAGFSGRRRAYYIPG